jgi:hypothetical protein
LKEEKKIAIFGEKKNRSSKTNKAKKKGKKKNRFKNRVVDFGDRKWHRKIDQ